MSFSYLIDMTQLGTSHESTVRANNLCVYPAPLGAGEKRHDLGDILRKPQTFQRGQFRELIDERLTLAFEKQISSDRAWRDRVHRYIATTQLIGEHVHQALDARFGGDVGAVSRKGLRHYAARKRDDPAAGR